MTILEDITTTMATAIADTDALILTLKQRNENIGKLLEHFLILTSSGKDQNNEC